MIQTTGNTVATYKFTPKYILKAGQKVKVRVYFSENFIDFSGRTDQLVSFYTLSFDISTLVTTPSLL